MAHDDRIAINNDDGHRELPFDSPLSTSSYRPAWFERLFRETVLNTSSEEAERNFTEAGIVVSTICAAYRSARADGVRQELRFGNALPR